MTVHKAKGLEADDVIIVNLVDDLYGFPNRVSDDPILQLLLDNGDDYEFAEERRLFYVALTRTKNKVYLLGGSFNEGKRISPFSEELVGYESSAVAVYEDKEAPDRSIVCPRCGTGILVARQNSSNGSVFVGCSNYPYCTKTYTQTEVLQDGIRCPSCEGWMVRRKRRSDGKPFFGCSNYPDCKATIDFDEAGIR